VEEKQATPMSSLEQLATYMQGSFRNEAQAVADPGYFDLSLEVTRIWPERQDGFWLYMEQSLSHTRENPFRQRIYHLDEYVGDTILLSVYAMPDPLRYAGAYQNDSILSLIHPDSITQKMGCHLYFTEQVDPVSFAGVNKPYSCEVQIKGVSYLRSEVTVFEDSLHSWDRGYDESGNIVWGEDKGAYRFVRLP
jgi:hypothetical protein